jgi:hypothetical protein
LEVELLSYPPIIVFAKPVSKQYNASSVEGWAELGKIGKDGKAAKETFGSRNATRGPTRGNHVI